MRESRRRAGVLTVADPVVDLEAYRLAKKVYWLSVFYDRNIPFEDVYEGVLVLLDKYRSEELPDGFEPDGFGNE